MKEINKINYVTASDIARKYGTTIGAVNVLIEHDIEARRQNLTPLLPQFISLDGVKYWPETEMNFILQRLAFRPMMQKKVFGDIAIEGPSKNNAYQRMKMERDYFMKKYEEIERLREA